MSETSTSLRHRMRAALPATGWLAAGLGTSLLALMTLAATLAVTALCLVGIGLVLIQPWAGLVRTVANLERSRLRRLGYEVESSYDEIPPEPLPALRAILADHTLRRDLGWMATAGSAGFLLAALGLQPPVNVVRELTFPLWWYLVPPAEATALNGFVPIQTWAGAFLIAATAPVWAALWLVVTPRFTRWHAALAAKLLRPHPDIDLSLRVEQLTATRAAALDAHAVELRRIERALHDGAQNRLVAVTVLTGAARQAMTQNPQRAAEVLDKAQSTAEEALAELRGVVRSILPPVLENDGLEGALHGLAAQCPVPCHIDVHIGQRCPASVESTAYFVAAEALTNIAKHSGARSAAIALTRQDATLRVRVTDDGHGGVDTERGTGVEGIRRRVAALDGQFQVNSPPGGPTELEVELPCGS